MAFLKREKGILEKQQAVEARLVTLQAQMENKEKGIEQARSTLSAALGELALVDNEQNQAAVAHSKKALARQEDGLQDIKIMLDALSTEKEKLAKAALEACAREAPQKAAEHATAYNTLLQEAVKVLQVLRDFHQQLLKEQASYKTVLDERARALQTLGLVEPLEMAIGLGELALVPVPFRHVMQTPDAGLDRFLLELIGYERKLLDYRAGAGTLPDHAKIWAVGDKAGLGEEIGAPNRDKSFRQVHEPGQPPQQ
jgi:hypothetical protein